MRRASRRIEADAMAMFSKPVHIDGVKGKMEMKEAILYQKLGEGQVHCQVCSHRCVIKEGRRGICGVRENHKGTLYALNDGKTIAAGIDPIEKKPLYHFLPGTLIYSFASAGCNFRCAWCQNFGIAQGPKPYEPVQGVEVLPAEHVERALENGCPAIAYTYSEPTIFLEYALATMKTAHAKGLKNVWVTNGFMTRETLEVILPYLDAVNVDFKGPDDGMYERYCGGSAGPVMENLRHLVESGVHVEVTTLLVPGINDKADQIEEVARFISEELGPGIPWHISRFFPAWQLMDTPVTPLKTLILAKEIGEKAHLTRIHLGNV